VEARLADDADLSLGHRQEYVQGAKKAIIGIKKPQAKLRGYADKRQAENPTT
jgi:hypothetical protein